MTFICTCKAVLFMGGSQKYNGKSKKSNQNDKILYDSIILNYSTELK